ncbi:GNAT family N-acetyltransferase [Aliifodinibius sp. S!AR15-10]|uniref:GNAT family N-acetyltransferase n=1 Tax=Aliifodinibius sp. S!AR15-10 TaxID=2950437 RepID=UPI00285F9FF2|nr:GNAT family N-acetyltransferase [Aliifodinibius sp. S!AR15-10]MDR8394367.1 GNAT family N-acetyltransferase [Aliifodinibius sp. S!AR15-10]
MVDLKIIEIDYDNDRHASAVIRLTDMYARDEMGMDEPLPNATRIRLIEKLRDLPNAFTLLAVKDKRAVGIANCFVGFSTFEGRRLINIHDLAVMPKYRGVGIGEQLLEAVQKKAKKMECCRITLEVREDNPAFDLYERFGFENGDPGMLFMSKELY